MAKVTFYQGSTISLDIASEDIVLADVPFVVSVFRENYDEAHIYNKSQLVANADGSYTLLITGAVSSSWHPGEYSVEVKVNNGTQIVSLTNGVFDLNIATTKDLIND